MARPLVNSGRLSRPWSGERPAPDAPVLREGAPDWLLRHLGGPGFSLVAREAQPATLDGIRPVLLADAPRPGALHDHSGLAARRLGLAPGECVLFRPDAIEAARFPHPDPAAILAARQQALAA